MKYLKGGAAASQKSKRKLSRKLRSRTRSDSFRPKKTIRKTSLRRIKSDPSLSQKKKKGVKFAKKTRKLLYGKLNNGTGKYSEWRENVNHRPLENCVQVNDTAIGLPIMYNLYTKKRGTKAHHTDNIGTVHTCLPDEYPYLGKSDDNRWCCFRTIEEAKKNDQLASNVKKNLKQQQHNIHEEYASSLQAGSVIGPVSWTRANKKVSQKEAHNTLTGKHLICNPADSGRMRNPDMCFTDMYPCYDPKDNKCYNIDGDVSLMPAIKMSSKGNNLRRQLRAIRGKGPKKSIML